jgi:hypothetical protein
MHGDAGRPHEHYCFLCGGWRVLDRITHWCGQCTALWRDRITAARGERS